MHWTVGRCLVPRNIFCYFPGPSPVYIGEVFEKPFYVCDTSESSCADQCGYFRDIIGVCQCDDVCIFYKDCCIDYEKVCIVNDTETRMTSFSGIYLERIFAERVGAELPYNLSEDQFSCMKFDLYRDKDMKPQEILLNVINKCQDGYSETEMKHMCESAVTGLHFNIPVTDYKFLYKNAYCALCNLQSNYTPLSIVAFKGDGLASKEILNPLDIWQESFRSQFLSSPLQFYITDKLLIDSAMSVRFLRCSITEVMDSLYSFMAAQGIGLGEYVPINHPHSVKSFLHKLMADKTTPLYKEIFGGVNNETLMQVPSEVYFNNFVMEVIISDKPGQGLPYENPLKALIAFPQTNMSDLKCSKWDSKSVKLQVSGFDSIQFDAPQGKLTHGQSYCPIGQIYDVVNEKCTELSCGDSSVNINLSLNEILMNYQECLENITADSSNIESSSKLNLKFVYSTENGLMQEEDIADFLYFLPNYNFEFDHTTSKSREFVTFVYIGNTFESHLSFADIIELESSNSYLSESFDIFDTIISSPTMACQYGMEKLSFESTLATFDINGELFMYEKDNGYLHRLSDVEFEIRLHVNESRISINSTKLCLPKIITCNVKVVLASDVYSVIYENNSMAISLSNGRKLNSHEFEYTNGNHQESVRICLEDAPPTEYDSRSLFGIVGTMTACGCLVITFMTIFCIWKSMKK